MTYIEYVVAAYAVFVLVLGSDAIGSWLRLRWARRLGLKSKCATVAEQVPLIHQVFTPSGVFLIKDCGQTAIGPISVQAYRTRRVKRA